MSCSIFSPAFGVYGILDSGHSNRCVVVSDFNLYSPDDIWCEASLHKLICSLSIFFVTCLLSSLAHFQSGCFLFLLDFIYLFIFRERGREGEREGEKHLCVVASYTPHTWGPGPQPRHVPWLGIKPTTLWFTGQHSIHWATPARTGCFLIAAF